MIRNTWSKFLREISPTLFGSRARTIRRQAPTFKPTVTQLEDRFAPAVAFALSGSNLLAFDTVAPGTIQTTAITNVNSGETLVGIDFRPQNGHLYSLGVTTAGTGTLYDISTRTGVATQIGTTGGVTPTAPMPDPSLASSGFGFDFNPLVDRIRVVTSAGQSFVIDQNTGLVVANAPTLNGDTTTADGTSYTNNHANATATTLYTINSTNDTLYLQNAGTSLTTAVGTGIGFDFTRINGFDIPTGVNATTTGTPVTTGSAFAILNVGGTTGLYSIDLVTGAGTLIGNVGNGTTAVQGLAIQNDFGGIPAIALDGAGFNLVRFNTATPGTTTTQAITGITAGETLVGIDFRPQNGLLFGLGINGVADTGTLYRIDPQTGAATIISTPGGTPGTITGSFPDVPTTSGFGFDFNATVDLIRVVTSNGLNFAINPNSGAVAAVQTNINGSGVTGVSATAYTNNFGQVTGVGNPTTQYTLDDVTDTLYIQNPSASGTQTNPLPVTVGGNPLLFGPVNGFDIPGGVDATLPIGTPVTSGFGYAVLRVGGAITNLYQIDLTSGAATSLGAVGAGDFGVSGFTLADPGATLVGVTDDFNRANNPANLGPNWTTQTGTATINNNMGVADPNAVTLATFNTETFADVVVQADFNNVTANGARVGLVARYTGTGEFNSNFYLGLVWKSTVTGNYEAYLFRKQIGTGYQQLGPTVDLAGIFTGTGTLRFEVIGDQLKLFVNDTLRLVAYDSTIVGVGRVGVRAQAANFDNFNATDAAPEPEVLPFADDFSNINNADLKRVWTERAGAFTIQGNAAAATNIVTNASLATLNTAAVADAVVSADLAITTSGGYAGLVARQTGTSDANSSYYLAVVDRLGAVFTASIFRKAAGGGFTLLASRDVSGTFNGPGPKTMRFEVLGNQQKLYINNTIQVLTYDSVLTTPGLVGMRGFSAGFDNFNSRSAPAIFAAFPSTDNFNTVAPDKPSLDRRWTERVGAFNTQNDNANAAQVGVNLATYNTAPLPNVRISAGVNITAIGSYAGLVGRYSGPGDDNFYLAVLFNNGGIFEAYIFKKQAGVFTQLSAQTVGFPVVFAGTGLLEFNLANQTLELRVNGVLFGTANDSSFATGLTGMRASGASLDDFLIQ